jgi:hypothetical protein
MIPPRAAAAKDRCKGTHQAILIQPCLNLIGSFSALAKPDVVLFFSVPRSRLAMATKLLGNFAARKRRRIRGRVANPA